MIVIMTITPISNGIEKIEHLEAIKKLLVALCGREIINMYLCHVQCTVNYKSVGMYIYFSPM